MDPSAVGVTNAVLARFVVSPHEPVLAGHYPGFPIFPGVCLLECAQQACLASLDDDTGERVRLSAIESARFVSPTFPGDELSVEVHWDLTSGSPNAKVARVQIRATQGLAAKFRLRFEMKEQA